MIDEPIKKHLSPASIECKKRWVGRNKKRIKAYAKKYYQKNKDIMKLKALTRGRGILI